MMLVLSPRLITVNLNRAKLRHNKEEENVSGREFNLAAVFHISMEFFGFARIQEEGNITKRINTAAYAGKNYIYTALNNFNCSGI